MSAALGIALEAKQRASLVTIANVVGDGITNDHVSLQTALNLGKILYLNGGTYRINESLTSGDNDLYIIGPGTILHPRSKSAVIFNPSWPSATTISAIATEIYFPTTGAPVSKLTVGAVGDIVVGDTVMVRSLDNATNDGTVQAKHGELATVLGIVDNTIWLSTLLQGAYTQTPMLQRLPRQRLFIDGGVKFSCYENINTPGSPRIGTVIELRGAVRPYLDCEIENAPSRGIFAFSCWRPFIKLRGRNFRDDNPDAAYGYGVSIAGATRYGKIEIHIENARHAFTTNIWPPSQPWHYGEPRDCTITGSAVNTTAAGWDTHMGAYNMVFENITHHQDVADGASQAGLRYAFQSRSIGTIVRGLTCSGWSNGLYLPVPYDPGFNYETVIDGYTASTTAVEVAANGNTQPSFLTAPASSAVGRHTIIINNARTTRRSPDLAGNIKLRITNSTFNDARLFRLFGPTYLLNCVRTTTSTNSDEPITLRNSQPLTIHNCHFEGQYFTSSYVRAVGTGVTANLRSGVVTNDGRTDQTFATTDGVATLTHRTATVVTGAT